MKKIFTLAFASFLALASFGQDVIEVTFDKFYNDPSYTPRELYTGRNGNTIVIGGDWLISLNNDEAQFTFDFFGGTPDSFTGTYMIDSIDTSFSVGYYQKKRVDYKTCNLTITETRPSATITRYVLEADIVSEDDEHYLVRATHDVLTAAETVTAEILDAQITPTDYGFLLTANAEEKNLDIQLAIKWSFGIEGYFSSKVVDTVNTVITHNGKSFDPVELEMDIVFAEKLPSGYPGYSISNLHFLSPDVVAYDLKLEAPIVATDTVDVTCTNLAWDESQKKESAIMFEASNETYSVNGMLSDTILTKGTYEGEEASVDLMHTETGNTIGALLTKVVVAGNKLKGYTAEVELLGDDSKLYLIHLSKSKETTDLEDIKATTGVKKMLVNGTLVILKDDVIYNAQGQTL